MFATAWQWAQHQNVYLWALGLGGFGLLDAPCARTASRPSHRARPDDRGVRPVGVAVPMHPYI